MLGGPLPPGVAAGDADDTASLAALEAVARLLEGDSNFLAFWLAGRRHAIAGRLGLDQRAAAALGICLAPRRRSFDADIAKIAAYLGCRPGALETELRACGVAGIDR